MEELLLRRFEAFAAAAALALFLRTRHGMFPSSHDEGTAPLLSKFVVSEASSGDVDRRDEI
jgi:hypothetical protein